MWPEIQCAFVFKRHKVSAAKTNVKNKRATWLKAATPPCSCVITERRSGSEPKCFKTHLRVSQSDQWIKDLEPSECHIWNSKNPAETRCRRTKPGKKMERGQTVCGDCRCIPFLSTPLRSAPLRSWRLSWNSYRPTVSVLRREGQQQEPKVFFKFVLSMFPSLPQRSIRHCFVFCRLLIAMTLAPFPSIITRVCRASDLWYTCLVSPL